MISAVKAYDFNYGYASNLYTTNWLQWNDEAEATWTAFTNIADLFDDPVAYYWDEVCEDWFYYGPAWGEVDNWGSTETNFTVYARIDHDNTWHSAFSTVLYVGHGGPYGFYGNTDYPYNQYIYPDLIAFDQQGSSNPNNIRSRTQSSPAHQFVFMWVCWGGNNSPEGSPSAWNPLYWSNPPAYGPYTWVGFDDASPWLIDQMGTYQGENPNIFRYWLVFFYYFALNGNSVMSALNSASDATGFDNYATSILGTGSENWTYWPYYPDDDWYGGRMHVAGDPYGTYLPIELYLSP
jgi:hypothetical protein